jgi:hypothetical protein
VVSWVLLSYLPLRRANEVYLYFVKEREERKREKREREKEREERRRFVRVQQV